jgi:hypothetical protein
MKRIVWISLIMFAADLFAQSAIPAGTILPVALNSSLNSRKVKAGQVITARVMQDVPLSSGSTIRPTSANVDKEFLNTTRRSNRKLQDRP